MAHRTPFYLYKRHKKKGDYWYVCYLDPETGAQGIARSVDCLKERLGIYDFRPVTKKVEAVIISQKALEQGLIFNTLSKEKFTDYCLRFWDYETSDYILMKNRLKENSIGREYAYNMQKGFRKNVVPLLPTGLKLADVTTKILDGVIKELYRQKLSSGTIKVLEYAMSVPLGEAVRVGAIPKNPIEGILRGPKIERKRGALSRSEINELLLKLEEKRDELFPSYYYGIILAISTGMRCSEIRALRLVDFAPTSYEGLSKILIRHSVGYISGLKETKGKYERAVLIPTSLEEELKANASEAGIVLPSRQNDKKFMSSPSLRNTFYDMLEEIGIDGKEREERNLTFHSLRHTFSTLCRDEHISQEDRMLVMGHKSAEVNERYTHASEEALYRVSAFTQKVLEKQGKNTPSACEARMQFSETQNT